MRRRHAQLFGRAAVRDRRHGPAGDRGGDRRRRRDPDRRTARVQGLLRDPAATEETIDAEGWLHSGDLGEIDEDGFVSITGRKKDLIITSSGKNVTPVNIESELRNSRYISEAIVYGDNRSYLVALLTLDPDEAVKLAERLGIATDPATIATDPGVHAELKTEVERVNQKFARIQQIKRFAILEHELSQEGGELTPTLKVKRAVVYEKYADVFDGLYARAYVSRARPLSTRGPGQNRQNTGTSHTATTKNNKTRHSPSFQ